MVEMITQVNNAINGVVWGPFGLALLFCTGFWMSARTGFFQFRKMGYWLRHTIGAIFTNKDITAHTSKEDMAISQFQSMCTALAGTIGTGNIVGVATAIVSGGPGAIFWMWVMALLGMMTSFSENVLGVYYRRKNEKGEWSGGAMSTSPMVLAQRRAANSWARCWQCCLPASAFWLPLALAT